ncbi:MAG TPA: aldo/keto reductase [Longimicrobium sp.]|nr:aldo/keto reductase [Longimicrobium sp.]
MKTRKLGRSGPEVSEIGLGCMGMSGMYGPADRDESIATIHAAVEAGVTLLDTGDFYGMGHNELLIRDALRGANRDNVLLSVKFGAMRAPSGAFVGVDARPAAVKSFLAYTLQRLGTDHVDIYRPARLDPNVPIEDTVGAIKEMIDAGHVRHLGLSEMGAETIRRAHAVHPVVDLQIEYSLISRSVEAEILPTLRELGIGMTAYGVLSRGLLSSTPATGTGGPGDFRSHLPRFQGENLEHNLRLVDRLKEIGRERGASVAQLAIAWAMSRGEDVVPLIGARTRERLAEALGALETPLSAEELARIEEAVPPDAAAGDRYSADQMAMLDSERGAAAMAAAAH